MNQVIIESIGFFFYFYCYSIINSLYTDKLVNSEGQDEMQHHAAFHQGVHCLLRLKQPPGTEIHHVTH